MAAAAAATAAAGGLTARIVGSLTAGGVLAAGDAPGDLDDRGVQEDDYAMLHDEEEEEEEVVEVDEAEVLRCLDAMEPPLQVCRRLFFEQQQGDGDGGALSQDLRVLPTEAVAALYRHGWAVLRPGAFSERDATAARDVALGLHRDEASGVFGPPPSHGAFTDASARGDSIAWLRPGVAPADGGAPGLCAALDCLGAVRDDLTRVMRLSGGAEYQLAVYPGGGAEYQRHRDAFPDDGAAGEDQRRVTARARPAAHGRGLQQHVRGGVCGRPRHAHASTRPCCSSTATTGTASATAERCACTWRLRTARRARLWTSRLPAACSRCFLAALSTTR